MRPRGNSYARGEHFGPPRASLASEVDIAKLFVVVDQPLSLGVAPGDYFGTNAAQVAMIGDSMKCDRDGPREAGLMGFYLDRTWKSGFANLVQFARLVVEEF